MTVLYDGTKTTVISDLGTVTAYEYDIRSASNFIQTTNSSSDNGTTIVDQVATILLQKLNWDTDNELLMLSWGHPHVVIQYKTGECVLMGLEFGASAETNTADSGTAAADFNGYTLNIVGQENKPAPYLLDANLSDPFGGMASLVTVVKGTELVPPTS